MLKNILKSKTTIGILVLFLTTFGLNAQLFNVTYIDTTAFPTVKAGFIAKDLFGNDYPGITKSSFQLWEDGVNYAASATVQCKETNRFPPITVALVLDVSNSMNDETSNGEKKLRWVQDAAKMFFDTIKLDPPSSASIITFASTVTSNTGWKSSNGWFKDYLEFNVKIASGTTNFRWPFEEWKDPKGTYESFKLTNPKIRRVIIFLSDGDPDQEFKETEADAIIAHCKEQKTEVYSIMVSSPKNQYIEKICNLTGGKIYSIWSKDELIEIYREICGRIQSSYACELIWQAPMNCGIADLKRDVKIVFNPIPDSSITSYNVPIDAVARLEVSDAQLLFGAPSIGTTQRQLTITAKNSDFTITKETLNPNKDFKITWGKPLPFILKKDASQLVTIDYIESPVSASHEVLFTIEATPCPSQPISLIAPCGGDVVATSSLGDVAVSSSSNKSITCGFKNTTFIPITGEAKLGGTNASDFTLVTGGGAFTLQPGACLDLTVKGSPTSEGAKSAYIEYVIPSFCGTPKTNLTMNAVNSSFPMPNLDYLVVRQKTSKDLTYTVTNSGTTPVSITDITLSNTALTDYVITKPTFPQNLAIGGKLDFNVKFTPSTLGLIENDVVITLQGNPNKPSGKLSGIGGLPVIQADDVNYGSVKILSTKAGNIEIKNTSTTMDLTIPSITMAASSDFKFGTGATLTNVIVAKGTSKMIPVDFTPQSAGVKTVVVTINNDAVTGPTVVNKNTPVTLTGTGAGLILTPSPLDFGNVIFCGNGVTKQVTFKNETTESWTITGTSISGTGAAAYKAVAVNNTIAAGTTGTFNVTFTPTAAQAYAASLDVAINAGTGGTLTGSAQLAGTGVILRQRVSFTSPIYNPKAGKDEVFGFKMDVPSSANNLDKVQFTIAYYDRMFQYKENSLSPGADYAGWTWSVDESTLGKLVITGSGPINNSKKTITGSLTLASFVSDQYSGFISITPKFFGENACITGLTDSSIVTINTCFTKGTLIIATGTSEYALYDAEPNPAGNSTKIKFDIALKANASLELFNSMGQPISVLKNEMLSNGSYEVFLNTADLPSGIYYYRLSSAFYTETKKLVIAK